MANMRTCCMALGLALSASVAAPASAQMREAKASRVTAVTVSDDGYLYLTLQETISRRTWGCRDTKLARSARKLDDAPAQAWLKLALVSYRYRKPLRIWGRGCTSSAIPVFTKLRLE